MLGTFLGPEGTMVKKPKFLSLRSLQCGGRDIINQHTLLISNKRYERQYSSVRKYKVVGGAV